MGFETSEFKAHKALCEVLPQLPDYTVEARGEEKESTTEARREAPASTVALHDVTISMQILRHLS